jgi:hypothetical protein
MDSQIRTTLGRVQHTERRSKNPLCKKASDETIFNVILAAENSVKTKSGYKTRKKGS